MAIEFLKDHCKFAKGDVVDSHPNSDYLIILGVAKQKGSTKATVKKEEEAAAKPLGNKNKAK